MKMKLTSKLTAAILMMSALPAQAYTVSIINPAQEQAYLRPAQNIDISVQVSPTPTPLHTLVVRLNGNYIAANQNNLSLATIDYDVGNYLLSAELQSETGQVIAQDSRMIYIIPQNNLISQERERQAAQQAAYDALPWYKKLYINMRQGDVELTVTQPPSGTITGIDTAPTATRPAAASLATGVPTISGYRGFSGVNTNTATNQVSLTPSATNQSGN